MNRDIEKVLRIYGKPPSIPSGCSFAWDYSASPPKIWYETAAGTITEWTGAASGISNPLTVDLDADGNNIIGLPTPTADSYAANKKYVDDAISAIPGGSGITQSSWLSASTTSGLTGTAKTALQSTERVVMSGNIAFATSWGSGANCCILSSTHRPTSGTRMATVQVVNSAYTSATSVPVTIDYNGNVKNMSGSVISGASYIYFDGVSFQRDQP